MKKQIILASIISLASMSSVADKGDIYLGAGTYFGQYQFNEPEFTTETTDVFAPLFYGGWHFTAIDAIEFGTASFDEQIGGGRNAGPNEQGLDYESQQFYLQYNRKFRLARYIKPWVGLGVVSNTITASNKFETDQDGFLLQAFPDRDSTELSALFSIKQEFFLSEKIAFVPQVRYEQAFADGPEGFSFAATFQYVFTFGDN